MTRRRSVRDAEQAMSGLAASPEPAVVLSSLARCSAGWFSDICSVELSEGVEPLFRVAFAAGGGQAPVCGSGKQAGAVSTAFQAESTPGFPAYAGIMVHCWQARQPTEDDAIIARLLVDRAVAVVVSERLAQCRARADQRAAKLASELITSRAEGEAVGILTARHDAGRQEALRLLRRASQASQRTLYEVATDVIRGADLGHWPEPPGTGAPRAGLHIAASDGRTIARPARTAKESLGADSP
jgi:hypothetical protein